MRDYEDCLADLVSRLSLHTHTETVPLVRAVGRVCAQAVYAPRSVPPFPKAAMDGYAVRASDIQDAQKDAPVSLLVTQTLYAGDYAVVPVAEKSCVRVMTGAFVPPPYDTVIRQEDTDCGTDRVAIFTAHQAGTNYCAVGEDIRHGARIVAQGDVLSAVQIGLLSSVGLPTVRVYKRLRVAILVTGSEIVRAGVPLAKGNIYDNLGMTLYAMLTQRNITTVRLYYIPDNRKKIGNMIAKLSKKADIIITTGGVSVGAKDFVAGALTDVGAETVFAGVAVRPGSPTRAALVRGKPVLSLSGNPFAALAHVSLFFWHIVAALLGAGALIPQTQSAVLQHDWRKQRPVRTFVRAQYVNGTVTIPQTDHHASVIANLTECNCLADIPANTVLQAGARVTVRML